MSHLHTEVRGAPGLLWVEHFCKVKPRK